MNTRAGIIGTAAIVGGLVWLAYRASSSGDAGAGDGSEFPVINDPHLKDTLGTFENSPPALFFNPALMPSGPAPIGQREIRRVPIAGPPGSAESGDAGEGDPDTGTTGPDGVSIGITGQTVTPGAFVKGALFGLSLLAPTPFTPIAIFLGLAFGDPTRSLPKSIGTLTGIDVPDVEAIPDGIVTLGNIVFGPPATPTPTPEPDTPAPAPEPDPSITGFDVTVGTQTETPAPSPDDVPAPTGFDVTVGTQTESPAPSPDADPSTGQDTPTGNEGGAASDTGGGTDGGGDDT